VSRSAPRAEPPENEFAFAKSPLTERARRRPGHVVPLHVLNTAAAVADKVMMPRAFRIESRGAALDRHFTHQTRLHQVPQIVISRGPRRARIHAIHGFKDFRGRGMPVVFHQACHHGVALRSAPQSAAFQGPFNRLGVHEGFKTISNVRRCQGYANSNIIETDVTDPNGNVEKLTFGTNAYSDTRVVRPPRCGYSRTKLQSIGVKTGAVEYQQVHG